MDRNNLKKLIGRLFIFGFKGKTVDDHVKKLIHEYNVTSLILFSHNLGSEEEIIKLTSDLQKEAKSAGYKNPLLICIDQENGLVNRLDEVKFYLPGAMSLGAAASEEIAYKTGMLTSQYLKKLGINWNLAPVLDINTNPNNPGIGIRSFSDNPELASNLAYSFIEGHSENKVLTTIKHFPGLGNTSVDPHFGLPKIDKSIEELDEKELIPFKYAIDKGVDSVMTAHVLFPNIDPSNLPGTMSKVFLTDILKERYSFDGVIVTDCLEMDAISKHYGVGNGAVKALIAGADLVIVSHTEKLQEEAITCIEKAIENGEITINELEEKISRIEKLYERVENFDYNFNKEIDFSEVESFFIKSVTKVKEKSSFDFSKKIIAFVPENEKRFVGEKSNLDKQQNLRYSINEIFEDVNFVEYRKDNIFEQASIIKDYEDYNIIVGLLDNKLDDNVEQIFGKLADKNNLYTIAMRDPYPNKILYDNSEIWINTFQASPMPVMIAVKALAGRQQVNGKLPIKLTFK